jgi:Skp family chaperone for outer membrane proteins
MKKVIFLTVLLLSILSLITNAKETEKIIGTVGSE